MKQTIAISAFAGMLARQSGYTSDFCERFVIEMFKTVGDALKESDKVTVKGLGCFVVDNSGSVVFIPETSFASDINAPFECFEPEPLAEDMTDDILAYDNMEDDAEDFDASAPKEEVPTELSAEDKNGSQPVVDSVPEDESNPEVIETTADEVAEIRVEDEVPETDDVADEPENASLSQNIIGDAINDASCHVTLSEDLSGEINRRIADAEDVYPDREPRHRRHVIPFIFGVAVGALLGAAATYLLLVSTPQKETVEQINADEQEVAGDLGEIQLQSGADSGGDESMAEGNVEDTAVEPGKDVVDNTAANKMEETAVYDTVRTTLAQLSRKHYGRYEFWVYIYEENRDIISDPDRVEQNTRVRIPAPDKYGIDAHDNASVNEALKKAREISLEGK